MTEQAQEKSEVVYILGAGFSYPAKIPLQGRILEQIRDMDALDALGPFQESFIEHQGRGISFVNRLFKQAQNPNLEDVFTLLDQSIHNRNYCYGYDWRALEKIRNSFYRTIVMLFLTCEGGLKEKTWEFYQTVAAYVVGERLACDEKGGTISVILLNWDCVIENAIYGCLEKLNTAALDVDYCCYTYAMGADARHRSSILQKAMGLRNIKVMKLHGSVNWVICPNCKRLYVGLGADRNLVAEHIVERVCPACEAIFSGAVEEDWDKPLLEPFIISPTFVKQFDNAHIQMVWHNAYMDLCRADKIVFIGYSLPEADYHLRTLLKRAIRTGTEIDVVLVDDDRAPDEPAFENIRHKYAASRYEAFFGTGKHIKYYFEGVEGYFGEMCDGVTLDDRLTIIKAEHATVLDGFPL